MHNKFENTRLILTPRRPALVAGFDNQLEVLVRFQTPEAPVEAVRERPPYGISLVIDRSGSMAGRPIEEAKRCALFVVHSLRPDDVVSVVQFDNRIEVLCPPTAKGDGQTIGSAIARIFDGGNTDLHGGWRAGADGLSEIATATGLRRVILLSDGCANAGITDTSEIEAQCEALATQGVTTSTYGLGNGFNEELMVAMANSGRGNHYYGDTADDLMEPFQTEFDLLANLCLKGLKLSAAGGFSVEVLNEWKGDAATGWQMPDVAWDVEAWALLRVTIPKAALPAEGNTLDCLTVKVRGIDLDGGTHEFASMPLQLPVVNATAYGAIAEDDLVVRRLSEIDAGNLLMKARRSAMNHDWEDVDRLLDEAEKRFAGNAWVVSVVETIRTVAKGKDMYRFAKEAIYSKRRFDTRLAAKMESLDFSDDEATNYILRRKKSAGKAEPPASK